VLGQNLLCAALKVGARAALDHHNDRRANEVPAPARSLRDALRLRRSIAAIARAARSK
jgi:hypothetical protein